MVTPAEPSERPHVRASVGPHMHTHPCRLSLAPQMELGGGCANCHSARPKRLPPVRKIHAAPDCTWLSKTVRCRRINAPYASAGETLTPAWRLHRLEIRLPPPPLRQHAHEAPPHRRPLQRSCVAAAAGTASDSASASATANAGAGVGGGGRGRARSTTSPVNALSWPGVGRTASAAAAGAPPCGAATPPPRRAPLPLPPRKPFLKPPLKPSSRPFLTPGTVPLPRRSTPTAAVPEASSPGLAEPAGDRPETSGCSRYSGELAVPAVLEYSPAMGGSPVAAASPSRPASPSSMLPSRTGMNRSAASNAPAPAAAPSPASSAASSSAMRASSAS
eukprot:364644-Chlamydomonas_euryale.AAC.4